MPFDMSWPGAGASTMNSPLPADPLPPSGIIAEVRREGFHPVSRPVHRGRVYVLFAVDQDDMDVKLTVDAASGRVLWAAGVAAHLGGPGRYGYRSHWRAERLSPSAGDDDISNAAPPPPVRSDGRTARARRSVYQKRFQPVTRTRPVDIDGSSPVAHGESQEPEVLPPIMPLE